MNCRAALIFCSDFKAVREEWNRRYQAAGLAPSDEACREIDAWFYSEKEKHLRTCPKCSKEEK